MLPNVDPFVLPSPPAALLDGASLFVDFDGTLVELADRPDMVVADDPLRDLLAALGVALGGRLAVVSGRSIAQLDAMLGPIAQDIALSGSHGNEHRWRGVTAHPVRPAGMDAAGDAMRAFAEQHPGTLVEIKSFGVALHYRMTPEIEEEAKALVERLSVEHELAIQPGKMMSELRIAGGGKGAAVRRLMDRAPMAGTRPLFIGDDVTDEGGFAAAAELGGFGILVGPPRETAAAYNLPDVAATRDWLAGCTA